MNKKPTVVETIEMDDLLKFYFWYREEINDSYEASFLADDMEDCAKHLRLLSDNIKDQDIVSYVSQMTIVSKKLEYIFYMLNRNLTRNIQEVR